MIIGLDTRVLLCNLPTTIQGFTTISRDGQFYTIVINAKLDKETQKQTYIHECGHIINGDFEKHISADMIETEARRREKKKC